MPKSKKSPQNILLLDDEQDLLDLYREILSGLPSGPNVRTTTSGAAAIQLLETEPFNLLICDLSMPKMDGLQVLAIVRRKFPRLRTAILTSVADEQFRARAYAMGVDLFLEKPSTSKEIQLLRDCVESLLGQEIQEGFRGLQSKSLVDIIQMEGLSQSSSTLKVSNGRQEGYIWFVNGELTDAATESLQGEEAFFHILSWKTGCFESGPPDLNRPRRIKTSYHALLLESARVADEAGTAAQAGEADTAHPESVDQSLLRCISRNPGVEFVLSNDAQLEEGMEALGLENPEEVSRWARETCQRLGQLGEFMNAGHFEGMQGMGLQRNLALASRPEGELLVGFHRTLSPAEVDRAMTQILDQETL